MCHLYSNARKALTILFCSLISFALHAQNIGALSDEGRKNWKAASALLEGASSTDELIFVIQQFEKVTNSDPDYADTYYNLGKLYTKVGNEKGEKYLDKAQSYYEKYKSLHPEDSELINDEIYVLNVLREKYLNGPNRFNGKWGYNSNYSSGWLVDIKYDGSAYQLSFYDTPESIEMVNSTTWNFIRHRQCDCKQELRARGSTKYVDDCTSDADDGFPTRGHYYYDSWKTETTYQISLTGKAPSIKVIKRRYRHYLNGSLTYSETVTNNPLFITDYLVRK